MPPRAGRTPFRARERDRRYAKIVQAAAAHPFGTMHVIPVQFPDEQVSKQHAWKIRGEVRFQGYSPKISWDVHDDGTVTLSFQIFDRDEARQYIAQSGKPLRYNTRRKPKEK